MLTKRNIFSFDAVFLIYKELRLRNVKCKQREVC